MRFPFLLSIILSAAAAFAQAPPAATKAKPSPAKSSPAKTTSPKPSSTVRPPGMTQTSTAESGGDDQVVIQIGDEKVTAKEFAAFIEALPEQYRAQAQGPAKRQVAEQVASMKLLAQEARKRGLDKDKVLQNRIMFQTENVLAGAALNDLMKSAKLEEGSVRKYYDDHKNEYEQVQAKHILVRFKDSPVPIRPDQKDLSDAEALAKAQELRKRVTGGEDFAAVAKAESDDTGSGAQGGDLGTFKRGSMVPAFEQTAFTLPAGQVSEPIKTQFGYHLIRVEKHETKNFDEVRPEIEGKLKPELAQKALEDLKKTSGITLNESFFGPASPAPGAPVAPGATPGAPPPPPVKN